MPRPLKWRSPQELVTKKEAGNPLERLLEIADQLKTGAEPCEALELEVEILLKLLPYFYAPLRAKEPKIKPAGDNNVQVVINRLEDQFKNPKVIDLPPKPALPAVNGTH